MGVGWDKFYEHGVEAGPCGKRGIWRVITAIILLHENFLQFDWLRAVVFQLNLKYLHVKITTFCG